MKILLVNPKIESSIWTYSEVLRIAGYGGYMPNIALPTIAALTPDDMEVTIVDEGAEEIDFEKEWDLVGITGYITQRNRMIRIAHECAAPRVLAGAASRALASRMIAAWPPTSTTCRSPASYASAT